MRRLRTPSLAAACLAALALAAPAPAQQAGAPPPESQAPAEPESRAERLDRLFAELAAAEQGEHQRIEHEIRRLLSRSGSDSMDLLLMRARNALEGEDPVRAIHHLSAAVEHKPDFAEAWNLRATAFYMRGRFGQALADIEQTLALEPRHFGALSGLGVILEQLGREADALAAYRAALAVNPHMEEAKESAERLAQKVDGRDI
ncbi:MAG: tetratricopeptide repeat protein [Pseudomonadota bacterium]